MSGGSCVDPEQGDAQDDCCPVVAGGFAEAGGESASLLEAADAAFDHVTALVDGWVEGLTGPLRLTRWTRQAC